MRILGEKYGSYSVANNRRRRLTPPQLFKSWIALSIGQISFQWMSIAETNCTINWIEIYMVDSALHLLKNWGLNKKILQTTQLNRLKIFAALDITSPPIIYRCA